MEESVQLKALDAMLEPLRALFEKPWEKGWEKLEIMGFMTPSSQYVLNFPGNPGVTMDLCKYTSSFLGHFGPFLELFNIRIYQESNVLNLVPMLVRIGFMGTCFDKEKHVG